MSPCMRRKNTPHHRYGGGETHPTSSQHVMFFQREAPHAPPECWCVYHNFFFNYSMQILNCSRQY